jgi:methylated-DNA-[protein]-cysteine S-methyltransferase
VSVRHGEIGTPLGRFTVFATDDGIVRTALDDEPFDAVLEEVESRFGPARRAPRTLSAALAELRAYFAGARPKLRSPVDLSWAGEGFTRRVYERAMQVRAGSLMTYGDLAAAAGSPRAHRAAGHAMRVCPIEIWIPCHRIVPAGPGFGAYGGHPERRELLLRLDGAI